MSELVRQTAKVQPGGKIEVIVPEFPEGSEVKVVISGRIRRIIAFSDRSKLEKSGDFPGLDLLRKTHNMIVRAFQRSVRHRFGTSYTASTTKREKPPGKKAQEIFRRYIPQGVRASEEFIQERRRASEL